MLVIDSINDKQFSGFQWIKMIKLAFILWIYVIFFYMRI